MHDLGRVFLSSPVANPERKWIDDIAIYCQYLAQEILLLTNFLLRTLTIYMTDLITNKRQCGIDSHHVNISENVDTLSYEQVTKTCQLVLTYAKKISTNHTIYYLLIFSLTGQPSNSSLPSFRSQYDFGARPGRQKQLTVAKHATKRYRAPTIFISTNTEQCKNFQVVGEKINLVTHTHNLMLQKF